MQILDNDLIPFPEVKSKKVKIKLQTNSKNNKYFKKEWNYLTRSDISHTDHCQTIITEINRIMIAMYKQEKKSFKAEKDFYLLVGAEIYDKVFSNLEYFDRHSNKLGHLDVVDGGEFEPEKIFFILDGDILLGELKVVFNESKPEYSRDNENKKIITFPTINEITSKNHINNNLKF